MLTKFSLFLLLFNVLASKTEWSPRLPHRLSSLALVKPKLFIKCTTMEGCTCEKNYLLCSHFPHKNTNTKYSSEYVGCIRKDKKSNCCPPNPKNHWFYRSNVYDATCIPNDAHLVSTKNTTAKDPDRFCKSSSKKERAVCRKLQNKKIEYQCQAWDEPCEETCMSGYAFQEGKCLKKCDDEPCKDEGSCVHGKCAKALKCKDEDETCGKGCKDGFKFEDGKCLKICRQDEGRCGEECKSNGEKTDLKSCGNKCIDVSTICEESACLDFENKKVCGKDRECFRPHHDDWRCGDRCFTNDSRKALMQCGEECVNKTIRIETCNDFNETKAETKHDVKEPLPHFPLEKIIQEGSKLTRVLVPVAVVSVLAVVALLAFLVIRHRRNNAKDEVIAVDDNPGYGYGEAGDSIEIVEFNPVYGDGNSDDEDVGVIFIKDYNPLYGRQGSQDNDEIVDINSVYGSQDSQDNDEIVDKNPVYGRQDDTEEEDEIIDVNPIYGRYDSTEDHDEIIEINSISK